MKKYIFLLAYLFSLTYGRAISEEAAASYFVTAMTPSSSNDLVALKRISDDTAKALSAAKKVRHRYLSYFEDLEKSSKKINYALLSYILNQIKVRPHGTLVDPDLPLPPEHLYLATSFLFMTPEEEGQLTERELLDIYNVLENVMTTYTRYEATLWDARNTSSVNGQLWLNEGVLQMASIELQKMQPQKPLAGIIDYDTLSVVPQHNDIMNPGRIIEKTSAAFQYSTSNVITFPLNLGRMHWIMLAIQRDGNIAVIDSYPIDRTDITKKIVADLNAHGIHDHLGNPIVFKPYESDRPLYTGLQSDDYQCGVHSLVYCTAITTAGSISGGMDIIHRDIATGKKITFADILNGTNSETSLTTKEAVFQNFRVQLQKLIADLKKRLLQ